MIHRIGSPPRVHEIVPCDYFDLTSVPPNAGDVVLARIGLVDVVEHELVEGVGIHRIGVPAVDQDVHSAAQRNESADRPTVLPLERVHKHVPEMMRYTGLRREPYFEPSVGPFRCGMRVQVPLHAQLLQRPAKEIWEVLAQRYEDEPFVRVVRYQDPVRSDNRSFDPLACNDSNRIDLHVLPHPSGHVLLMAILDNLGKGASGVAIQNLNLMLGLEETTGLTAGR